MRWIRVVVAATIAAGTVLASTAAQAAPSVPRNGVVAQYEGRTIALKDGWAGAQTCVVHSAALVRCYSSAADADRVLGYSRDDDPLVRRAVTQGLDATAVPACASGWVCLWAAINGGGRRLMFRDEVYQSLADFAFANQLSSWRNTQASADYAYIRDQDPGGPPNDSAASLSGGSYSSNVGPTWNDTADLVQG